MQSALIPDQGHELRQLIRRNREIGACVGCGSREVDADHADRTRDRCSLINQKNACQMDNHQILSLITIDSEDSFIHYTPYSEWFNSEIPETIDKYLGVRFIDTDSLDHYGWIRCDVVDAGSTLNIKSYAYNEIPGQGIIAGKQLADEEVPLYYLYWHIYSSYNQIIIENDLNIAGHSEVRVFNTQGAIIYENVLAEAITYISMENLVSGVYIVHVQNAFTNTSKKVIIH